MSYKFNPRKRKAVRKRQYKAYLKSPRWKEKAQRIMRKAGGRCRVCGKSANHVHHETYKRRGRERDTDLTAMCRSCHTRRHRNN